MDEAKGRDDDDGASTDSGGAGSRRERKQEPPESVKLPKVSTAEAKRAREIVSGVGVSRDSLLFMVQRVRRSKGVSHPDYIEVLNRLVRFFERHGKWEEALGPLRELVDDPTWPRNRKLSNTQRFAMRRQLAIRLAALLEKTGDIEGAYFVLDDCVTLSTVEKVTAGLGKLKKLRMEVFVKLGGYDIPGEEL